MRRLFIIFIIAFGVTNAQTLHFEENFDYDLGTLTEVSINWTATAGFGPIQVVEGNLSFTDYPSSGNGRMIELVGTGSTSHRAGVGRTFPSISVNGDSVIASFLVRVTSTEFMNTLDSEGGYFAYFAPDVSSTATRTNVYVRKGATDQKFQIGLTKTSNNDLTFYSTELNVNETYLIVISYVFQAGSDVAKIWINPPLDGSLPGPDLENTSGTDSGGLGSIVFRQRTYIGQMYIDGVRVADNWAQAPLPVELTAFTANVFDGKVNLRWQTATEVDNYGFEVQRSAFSNQRPANWETIGFVEGHGNSNSPKNYEFTDSELPNSDAVSYRLKQIDIDGAYEYSNEIEVTLENIPAKFELSQNYPNPFNPVTKIQFALPQSETQHSVSLRVYDIIGREVAVLVNESKEAGIYEVEFDASKLSSGLYFYSLSAAGKTITKKMMLLR